MIWDVLMLIWRYSDMHIEKNFFQYDHIILKKHQIFEYYFFELFYQSWWRLPLLTLLTMTIDVFKWRHFPRYWPFVRGIHQSPVNSPTKDSDAELWCFLWSAPEQTVNNWDAGDLRCHRGNYDVTVMTRHINAFSAIKCFKGHHSVFLKKC